MTYFRCFFNSKHKRQMVEKGTCDNLTRCEKLLGNEVVSILFRNYRGD